MKTLFLLSLSLLAILATAQDFDHYLIQQWPGSYCDTEGGCCYRATGRPQNPSFTINGFRETNIAGGEISNCDPNNKFNLNEIQDLLFVMNELYWPKLDCPVGNGDELWSNEWSEHGTCVTSDQHFYFNTALDFHRRANIFQILQDSGIHPDGTDYNVESIKVAIRDSIGVMPDLECNKDISGNPQLFKVYLCISLSTVRFFDCPPNVDRSISCGFLGVKFPPFFVA